MTMQVDQKLEFPRNRLILDETIGEGEFGRVTFKILTTPNNNKFESSHLKILKIQFKWKKKLFYAGEIWSSA